MMSASQVTHRDTCRLCGSSSLALAVPILPTPIADAYVPADRRHAEQTLYPLDLYLCQQCGHVQLLDVVDPRLLFGDYVYTTGISPGLCEHFRVYALDTLRRFDCPRGSLVVDIGSNDGTLLRVFQERGLRVLGVDPAVRIARQATESGVETIPAFFTSTLAGRLREQYGPAAVITANNVFAHSDALGEMADGIRQLLSEDGVFIFEVSYLVDIVDKLLFDTVYHEHLCYHSLKPLDRFLREHGLELFDVTRTPSKGGSIRCFAQHLGGGRSRPPSVPALLALEQQMGMDGLEVYRRLTARIESLKRELLGLLSDLKSQGRTIAGYGASATVTTLLYHFELGPYLSYLVDDNPERHGLLSPGQHLPVLPPQTLLDRNTDYAVILAWQYATPILDRNRPFRQQGGRFVLPLPRVQVIPPLNSDTPHA